MNPIWLNAMMASGALWHAPLTNLVAVYQPIGAASLAASYVNLVNPGTYDAAPGVAPTWSAATGWAFNGTTQYLTTGVIAPSHDTWTIILRHSGFTAGTYTIGADHSANAGAILGLAPVVGANHYSLNGTSSIALPTAYPSGVHAVTGRAAYMNGAAISALSSTAYTNTGNTYGLYIGARHRTPGAANFGACNIQAIAICSTIQTPAQIAAASAAMAAL